MDSLFREISSFLAGLARRQRRLLGLQIGLSGLSVLIVGLVVAGALLSHGWHAGWVAAGVGFAAVGVWVMLVWRPLLLWGRAGDERFQAKHVEAGAPDLRGRLLTAVDRHSDRDIPDSRMSRALLGRAIERVAESVRGFEKSTIHSNQAVVRSAGIAAIALSVGLLGELWLPVGPLGALRVWMGGSVAEERLQTAELGAAVESALIGDIVLRYVYPAYTGVESVVVPNSDGTVHAPPGTTVHISARSEDTFDGAALQVDDGSPMDAQIRGGRDLVASFVVHQEGVWRFWLFNGDTVVQTRDFRIVNEADAPPVVTLDQSRERVVSVDRSVGIGWQAQDDFGLIRVSLEVTTEEGSHRIELRSPLDTPHALRGMIRATPRELGLRPGQSATRRVIATDNNQLGEAGEGASEAVEIAVVGPRGSGRRLARYHKALRDALLLAMADFLEEAVPPANTSLGMTRWASVARKRLESATEIYENQWGDDTPEGIDGTLVSKIFSVSARLIRFVLTTYDANSSRRITEQDLATLAQLHAQTIESLEQAVYVLDAMLRKTALASVAKQSEAIAELARDIATMSESMQAAELLSRLDRLGRLLGQLQHAAQQLSEGNLKEFVNSQVEQTMGVMDEIRKAIAEGRLEDAKQMLDQLARHLTQFSEGMGDQMAQRQQGEDQMSEAMDEVLDALGNQEKAQEALAQELAKARESMGDEFQQQADLWMKADRLSAKAVAQSAGALNATGTAQRWRTSTIRRIQRLGSVALELQQSVAARDPVAAHAEVVEAALPQQMAVRTVENERVRSRPAGEELAEGLEQVASQIGEVGVTFNELQRVLAQLAENATMDDPRLQQLAREMTRRQEEIRQNQEQLQNKVTALERALPTGDGSAGDSMERASDAMKRADSALQDGQALRGEGHQRDAAAGVGNAKRELERQWGEYQQMQQTMRQMQGEQSGEGSQDGSGQAQASNRDRIEIPAPESFQTPEEYRRALLQGMEGEVPEEYRALKKRYYEELVRQ